MLKPETRLLLVMEEFRKLDAVMPIQTAAAFLHIASASEDGTPVEMKKIQAALDLSSSSATRNVQALGVRTDDRKSGLDLVCTLPNPDDARSRCVQLTPKGRRVWKSIMRLME